MFIEEDPLAIMADDLTGACDSAGSFRRYGLRTVITDFCHLDWDSSVRVLAVNSDSRKQNSVTAYQRVQEISRQLLREGRIPFYKKVDSTLKGNWRCELAALVSTWLPDVVLVAPAFPVWGRTTEKGIQCVNGRPLSSVKIHHSERVEDSDATRSADLVQLLKEQFGRGVQLLDRSQLGRGPQWIERQIERYRFTGYRFLVFDAVSDDDLKCISLGGGRVSLKVLWVGSGGLARFLPLGWGCHHTEPIPPGTPQSEVTDGRKSILLVVGSLNPSNAEQLEYLAKQVPLTLIDVEEGDSQENPSTQAKREKALGSLKRGIHVAAHLPFRSIGAPLQSLHDTLQWLTASLIESEEVNGIVLVGGDTSMKVYRRVGASGIEILGEVQPGVPYGRWTGGLLSDRPVATKAGGFGQTDTLAKMVERLQPIASTFPDSEQKSGRKIVDTPLLS
jgi:uncharacterized protein YgbK (DUF1537 family)